uniref:1,4-alpha-D-glucan glucanohydrolase n=1 Tax=Rhizophora mucronata TaxID=61149 RepID=A0A2P2JSC4_RHIMU
MSTVTIEPFIRCSRRGGAFGLVSRRAKIMKPCSLKPPSNDAGFRGFKSQRRDHAIRASSASGTALVEKFESTDGGGDGDVFFKETFWVTRTEAVDGKIFVRLDQRNDKGNWHLTVGCSLPGKWILHWGVTYMDDEGSEWDLPPESMRPSHSISIKGYAMETPLEKSSEEDMFHEVKIDIDPKSAIAAINFVLKDAETGAWYQHKGRDFKVPLVDYLLDESNVVGAKRGFSIWPGALLSNILLNTQSSSKSSDSSNQSKDPKQEIRQLEAFYEEQPICKQVSIENSLTISAKKCPKTGKIILYLDTDLPGQVVVHWGVCKDGNKNWEIPAAPHPPETSIFKNKALRTLLQPKEDGNGCSGLFNLEKELVGFLFVLKLNENTWIKCMGNDFYIPLSSLNSLDAPPGQEKSVSSSVSGKTGEVNTVESNQEDSRTTTDGIITEITSVDNDISSKKSRKTKTKEAHKNILQEIERLAAEAYSIFRSSIPTFSVESVSISETQEVPPKISSGTGSGYEILLQGFNWESNKSGRWYWELKEKAAEISTLGFTVIWLPPATESVSPEGYMPKDLYNLNSRYGNIDELKDLVRRLHEVGIKVLGDVVLNHRCAHYQNKNGVWNIFGGRLNWDDRAVVADDPHFQGRGNKSSGDNFHAAPNIDHSQDFVRKDLKEWLCWLREEIGYDGWRLDFVRGFWGGYVKDYLDASKPYFAVGEYWDSLSYKYNEMDYNQDAHRQRIIDWINATNGTAGAFDVTTKGILHAVSQNL